MIEILKALLFGIVEGITEWLPVSSTGHMILIDEFVNLNVSDEFRELFLVVIQLGAILAVPILFFDKLNPFSKVKNNEEKRSVFSLWSKVFVGIIPAAVFGLLLDDWFDEHFYNYFVVSIALIVYGIAFIFVERLPNINKRGYTVDSVYSLTYKDTILIGLFQVLSLIPGTSRSGSTILGGMILGVNRAVSAEFSFFMAIPVMLGASLLKVAKFIIGGAVVTSLEIWILIVGIIVSFVVSVFTIKFLIEFVKRHSFSAFGIYRIILGIILVIYFLINSL